MSLAVGMALSTPAPAVSMDTEAAVDKALR